MTALFGGIFGFHNKEEGISWEEARDAAKLSIGHRTAPTTRMIQAKRSIVLRLRTPGINELSGISRHCKVLLPAL